MTDESPEFEMSLPFVTTVSEGGPHDDESYVSGFQMGQLDVILGFPFMQTHVMTIHTSNLRQADLIAMHYDFKMEVETEDDTWATVSFIRVCTCDTEENRPDGD